MNDSELRRLDLGLLLIFAEIIRLRQLTAVAERFGQTQSAISHAVARLRDIFGDELFLRRPHGMEPTARARALEPAVRQILDLARTQLGTPKPFDPLSASATIRIAAQDYHCGLFASPLISAIATAAPGIRLAFLPLPRAAALTALEAGDAQLAIGYFPVSEDRLVVEPLFTQGYVIAARRDHPRLAALASLAGYSTERHLLVSQSGDNRGVVDQALASAGTSRTVVATLPYYLAALDTVARTDFIITVPRAIADSYAEIFGLALVDPPLPVRQFTVSLSRHRREQGNAMLDWLAGLLRNMARSIGNPASARADPA